MPDKRDKPWTKSELTLRYGPKELAKAVIRQWKNDGCPAQDKLAIEYWYGIIRECNRLDEKKSKELI